MYAILEHEAMHQETLLYMWHRLPLSQKRRPADCVRPTDGVLPRQEWIEVPAGRATLGVNAGALPFSWDNERPACSRDVEAFAIQRHNVTNAAFLEFVQAGGYAEPRWWRPEDWNWVQRERVTHPLFWERTRGVVVAGDVRAAAAAAGVAGVCQLRGSLGLRKLAAMPFAHRGRVSARRLRHAVRRRAASSVGR